MSTVNYESSKLHAAAPYNGKTEKNDRHHTSSIKHKHKPDQNGIINHTGSSRHKTSREDKNDIPEEKYKVKTFGDWTEQTSRAGKRYFYNCKTEVSQWEKPQDWADFERQRYHALKKSANVQNSGDISSATQYNHHNSNLPVVASTSAATDDQSSRSSDHLRYPNSTLNSRLQQQGINLNASTSFNASTSNNSPSKHYANKRPDANASYDDQKFSTTHSPFNNSRPSEANRRTGSSNSKPYSNSGSNEAKKPRYDHHPMPSTSNFDGGSMRRFAPPDNTVKNEQSTTTVIPTDLPQSIAENIDYEDVNALEKMKLQLKAALRETEMQEGEAQNYPNSNGTTSKRSRDVVQKTEPVTASIPQPPESSQHFVFTDLPPMPLFSDTHALFFRENFSCKIKDWAATHFEIQANALSDRSFRTSLDVAQVSADLKCARSLVRTAEIKSTLVDHRVGYLRKQYNQLETLNKPTSSSSTSVLSFHTSN